MLELAGIVLFLVFATLAGGASAEKRSDVSLELELPGGVPPPSYAKERVSRLEIDGKDFSTPRSTRRIVSVRPKAGADTVKVVYTFWPTIYTRITRTKIVKAEKGKTVKVSLMKAEGDCPDRIWVIYVATPIEVVEAMAKLAKIGPDDVVWDVGCGDGRLVIHAVKERGAKKGVGIDLLAERVKESEAKAKEAGVEDRVTFQQKDALTIKDFSDATVVLLYLSNPLNEALRPALRKTLKPGSRIVSHRFLMGDWKPDRSETIRARDNHGKVKEFKLHLWTIKP
jgi:hypothetical protein